MRKSYTALMRMFASLRELQDAHREAEIKSNLNLEDLDLIQRKHETREALIAGIMKAANDVTQHAAQFGTEKCMDYPCDICGNPIRPIKLRA